jgi:anthranilate synthase/aminodeoxychorismate synthase-like glutamine amidotransferase
LSTVLLLDNKDSFVWNLAQAFQILGLDVHVVRSGVASDATVEDLKPGRIVISPGPGLPEGAGNSVALIREWSGRLPILGVCLGHQAIATAFGGSVFRAPPCHGKPWPIEHENSGLFANLPNPLTACRYHSLAVNPDDLPDCLIVDATTAEGLIMGLRHRSHPTFGLQFHPESFRTPAGLDVLRNFLEVTAG